MEGGTVKRCSLYLTQLESILLTTTITLDMPRLFASIRC